MRQDPNRGPALWSKPSRDPSLLLAAALLVAACNGEDDRCIEHRSARDFDEPSSLW